MNSTNVTRGTRANALLLLVVAALVAALLPSSAHALGIPDAPDAPGLPGDGLPGAPGLPNAPDTPERPGDGLPNVPGDELPAVPGDGLPNSPLPLIPELFCDTDAVSNLVPGGMPDGLPDGPPALGDTPEALQAAVDDCLSALDYQVRTVFETAEGDLIERWHDAKVFVPLLLDVDELAGPEVLVQFQIDAGRATMRASKLPSAPSVLPLLVEAVLADPRGGSDWRLGFGFDTLHASAPGVYEATVTLTGAGRTIGSIILDSRIAGAGPELAIIGGVFEVDEDGNRLEPQYARVNYAPVPTLTTVTLTSGDLALGQMGLSIVTDRATKATVTAESISGADRLAFDLVVDRVPQTVNITVATTPSGLRTLDYSASARIALIQGIIHSYRAGDLVNETILRLDDMPRSATIIQDSPTRARFTADSAIGALTIGFADGPVQFLNVPAYGYATDADGYQSLALRIPGLQAATVDTGENLLLEATLANRVPLHIRFIDGGRDVTGWVRDLPRQTKLQFNAVTGEVVFEGSATIDEFTVVASDPDGLMGRATDLDLLLRDIPTTLALSLAQSGDEVELDAKGKTLGLLQVHLTSGADNRYPAEIDGVLLRDLADEYEVFARLTGMKRVAAVAGPPPRLEIDTTSNRLFKLRMESEKPAKVEYTEVILDNLVPNIVLGIVDTPGGQVIEYSAAQPTKSLSFVSNAGDRWLMDASIGSPLPASLRICQDGANACGGSGRTANGGSVTISASEHTTLNLFDCVRPLNATCVRANATQDANMTFTRVDNLRVRQMVMDAHSGDAAYSGHMYLDTDNHEMSGSFLSRDAGGGGFRATFPANFRSNDRLGRWSGWGLSQTKTGTITCPSGTNISARVLGLWIGVTGYLC